MNEFIEKKLDAFFQQYSLLHFKKNETILSAGSDIVDIFYLKKGFVRQSLITVDGEDITLHVFKPVSFFPIMLALGKKSLSKYTFSALEALDLRRAPYEKMEAFLKTEPDVLFDLATRLSQGLNGLLTKIETGTFTNAYEKVVSLLLYLSKQFGKETGSSITITLPLTHPDIASWTGLQRETVSRQIEVLQDKGILHREKNHLVIIDMHKLQKEAQQEK